MTPLDQATLDAVCGHMPGWPDLPAIERFRVRELALTFLTAARAEGWGTPDEVTRLYDLLRTRTTERDRARDIAAHLEQEQADLGGWLDDQIGQRFRRGEDADCRVLSEVLGRLETP